MTFVLLFHDNWVLTRPAYHDIIGDMEPKTMTLKLNDRQLAALRGIAKSAGFVMERGKLAGDGSVQQMVEAIADGKYKMAIWPNND